jgi:hypothetical protein
MKRQYICINIKIYKEASQMRGFFVLSKMKNRKITYKNSAIAVVAVVVVAILKLGAG